MFSRRSMLLAFAFVLGAGTAAAAPQDKPFTVAKHPVDATDKDAVAAKAKAHGEGQQAAFRALLKRLVPVTSYNRLGRLKQIDAREFAQGLAIRSERNSGTQYIASLDFSFSPQGVRDLLRREGVPFIDAQAPLAVLVPVAREPEGAGRSRADEAWASVWGDLDLDNSVTPMKLETLKPALASAVAKLGADGGAADRQFSGEYGGRPVVVALAEIDASGKKATVTLAGRDAVGPISLKRTYRVADGDVAYALELAAVVALGTFEGRWKFVNAQSRGGDDVMSGPGASVRIQVEFSGPAQWYEIRQQLLNTPGVEDMREESVAARFAEVSLTFPGGAEQLAAALAPRGLSLRGAGGSWLLRLGS